MTYARRVAALLLLSALAVAAAAQRGARTASDSPDTARLDVAVAKADAKASAAGAGDDDKRAAAAALVKRGNVYYDAQTPRLYKFALADFRRALAYQPDLAEAREKADQIESIYRAMGRPVPVNGAEPAEWLSETVKGARRVELRGEPAAAAVEDEVGAGGVKDYVIAAAAGRDYTVSARSGKQPVRFNVYRVQDGVPVRLALDVEEWAREMRGAGDYLIRVGPAREKIAFTLEVKSSKAAASRKF